MKRTKGQKFVAREAARIVAAAPPPSQGGLILEWIPAHACFIVVIAADNVSWDHGHTATRIDPHDAVKMELLIAEKTKPIIEALAATAKPTSNSLGTTSVEWFPADDLPDDETTVLVATNEGEVYEAYHNGDAWWLTGEGMRPTDATIVAWGHIPDAPKIGGAS